MRGSRLTITGALVGVIGAVLLLVEGVRAVELNDVLGTLSQVLLWVGLGLMALGGLILVVGVVQGPEPLPFDQEPPATY
jgi:drug/metabolite transporter (DMT)-like permease